MDGCACDDEVVNPNSDELVDGVTVLAGVATAVVDAEESDDPDPESKPDNLSQKLEPPELLDVELVDAVDEVLESEFPPNKLLKSSKMKSHLKTQLRYHWKKKMMMMQLKMIEDCSINRSKILMKWW